MHEAEETEEMRFRKAASRETTDLHEYKQWLTEVSLHTSGGDTLRGHTRSHPEHDG